MSGGWGPLGRRLAGMAAATMLAVGVAQAAKTDTARPEPATSGKLAGRLLVAAPHMPDPRFAKTVILLVRHNDQGAMGLIVNRRIAVEPASTLVDRLIGKGRAAEGGRKVPIHYGGPVQLSRGMFLHSSDYAGAATVKVTDRVSLTRSHDILLDLAKGRGPSKGFLAMGYAGWGPGQLEEEMRRKDWITVSPDSRLVFDDQMESKWRRAMDKLGIDL